MAYSKNWKKNTSQLRILYPAEQTFRNKIEIRTHSVKPKKKKKRGFASCTLCCIRNTKDSSSDRNSRMPKGTQIHMKWWAMVKIIT